MKQEFRAALMLGACLLPAFAAGVSEAAGESASGFTVLEGLAYSTANPKLTMDLYLPKATGKPIPCVIAIQGGGFLAQDGKAFRPFAVYLAENGFAAALIAYRGSPDHTYKDTIADVKSAVIYVRRISSDLGIDPDRIGAVGRSAGATLAALLAVTGGTNDPEVEGGQNAPSSRIQAAVGFAGVYDFIARFTDERQVALQPRHEAKLQSNGAWIGEPFSASSQAWRDASPVVHLNAADPPMLLIHCEDDQTVPWMQSRDMYTRMQDLGIDAEIEIYKTGGHGCRTPDPTAPLARMVEFFERTLGPAH